MVFSKNNGCFSLHFNFHFLQRMRIACINSVVRCASRIIIAQMQMWRYRRPYYLLYLPVTNHLEILCVGCVTVLLEGTVHFVFPEE